MTMPDRFVYVGFQIDTNRINSKNKLNYMNKLEIWHNNGVIEIHMSASAYKEALRFKEAIKKTRTYPFACIDDTTDDPNQSDTDAFKEENDNDFSNDITGRKAKIEKILFPSGAKKQNEKNDVKIVFSALNHNSILITDDGHSNRQPGGILGNRDKLKADLGVTIMRDEDAVKLVENLIKKRDKKAREIAERTGKPLPDWVGQD